VLPGRRAGRHDRAPVRALVGEAVHFDRRMGAESRTHGFEAGRVGRALLTGGGPRCMNRTVRRADG
jgi:hypothetical protein